MQEDASNGPEPTDAAGGPAGPQQPAQPPAEPASQLGGILPSIFGAVVGAGLGAMVWATIVRLTGWMMGFVAMLVGAIAGWGAIVFTRRRDRTVGIVAAAATLAGVLAGSCLSYRGRLHSDRVKANLRSEFDRQILPKYPDPSALSEEQKSIEFEKFYQSTIDSEATSYWRYVRAHPTEFAFTAIFGLLGAAYAYRIGSSKPKSASA